MDDYYVRHNADYDYCLERMGLAILKHELKSAAYLLFHATTPAYRAQELSEAMVFVQGSGLEHVITTFGLEIDPGRFRETFFTWVSSRQRHHRSASSSAIMSSA